MQITSRLQTEIVEYLWQEMNNLPKGPQITNESSKNDIIAAAMSRGVRLGMDRAIMIINNWNKPDKGKVRAQVCSTQKSRCTACNGSGYGKVFRGPELGYKCEICNGQGEL